MDCSINKIIYKYGIYDFTFFTNRLYTGISVISRLCVSVGYRFDRLSVSVVCPVGLFLPFSSMTTKDLHCVINHVKFHYSVNSIKTESRVYIGTRITLRISRLRVYYDLTTGAGGGLLIITRQRCNNLHKSE